MVWRRSMAHLPRSVGTAAVPDIDGLRRTALQASWRRDRRVAQRRMAMRWAAWYAMRGLPLLAIAAAMWLWVLPKLNARALETANAPAQQASPPSGASIAPAGPVAGAPAPTPDANPATPDPQRDEPGLQLRLDGPFQPELPLAATPATTAQNIGGQAAGKAVSAKDSPSPQLKPDNWLHSQEP